jgi:hypothetical protein
MCSLIFIQLEITKKKKKEKKKKFSLQLTSSCYFPLDTIKKNAFPYEQGQILYSRPNVFTNLYKVKSSFELASFFILASMYADFKCVCIFILWCSLVYALHCISHMYSLFQCSFVCVYLNF